MKLYSKNSILKRLLINIQIVIGWIFIVPISLLVPRKKGLTIAIGRSSSYFLENVKYFFLYASKKSNNVFFLTENNTVYDELNTKISNIIKYPSFKSIFLLLRADFIVVDNTFWYRKFKFYLSIKAKKIQLWHGIGSKKINLNNPKLVNSKFKSIKILKGILIGELTKFYLFVSTSEYYSKSFKKSFRYKNMKELGYSRNDVLFREPNDLDLLGVDVKTYAILQKRKKEGAKVILYTPTFRDTGGDAFTDKALSVKELNDFAIVNNFVFVIKFHQFTDTKIMGLSNLLFYDKFKDIYPLMSLTDLMITDYSSIYLDFVILNKPIVFYIYDYEKYKSKDRSLMSDFLEITPGPKCKTQNKLFETLETILKNNNDGFIKERKKVLNISYKYKDGNSAKRIFKEMFGTI